MPRVSGRAGIDYLAGMEEKVCIVTGGTSGLGLALVEALHRAGAEVAFVARNADRVDETAQRYGLSMGIAGYILGVDPVAKVHRLRGIYA